MEFVPRLGQRYFIKEDVVGRGYQSLFSVSLPDIPQEAFEKGYLSIVCARTSVNKFPAQVVTPLLISSN